MTTNATPSPRWLQALRRNIGLAEAAILVSAALAWAVVVIIGLASGHLLLGISGALVMTLGVGYLIRRRPSRAMPALPDARQGNAAGLIRVLFGQDTAFEIHTDLDGPFRIVVRDLDDGQCIREDQRAWISKTVDITVPGRWQALWQADCRGVTFERTQEPGR